MRLYSFYLRRRTGNGYMVRFAKPEDRGGYIFSIALPTFVSCFATNDNRWWSYADVCRRHAAITKANLVTQVKLLTTVNGATTNSSPWWSWAGFTIYIRKIKDVYEKKGINIKLKNWKEMWKVHKILLRQPVRSLNGKESVTNRLVIRGLSVNFILCPSL